jgi:hypothetical protein
MDWLPSDAYEPKQLHRCALQNWFVTKLRFTSPTGERRRSRDRMSAAFAERERMSQLLRLYRRVVLALSSLSRMLLAVRRYPWISSRPNGLGANCTTCRRSRGYSRVTAASTCGRFCHRETTETS